MRYAKLLTCQNLHVETKGGEIFYGGKIVQQKDGEPERNLHLDVGN